MNLEGFGAALRQLRRELGLSQLALARELGTTQRHVSFLETGRSAPSRHMIGRLTTELRLNSAQRAALFNASGYRNPYRIREFQSAEVQAALDMIEVRVLRHWPFPAFVLDGAWSVLRCNAPGSALLRAFGADKPDRPTSMLETLLSDRFVAMIGNWEKARVALYFRVLSQAENNPELRRIFDDARIRGVFDGIAESLVASEDVPIFLPIELNLGGDAKVRFTSLVGQLASIHDTLVEGFEIEMLAPMDEESEAALRAMLAG